MDEGEYSFLLATPEKALCDQLYKSKPVGNYRELRELLFEDLRMYEEAVNGLRWEEVGFLASKYSSTNVQRFSAWLKRREHGQRS